MEIEWYVHEMQVIELQKQVRTENNNFFKSEIKF